MSDKTKIQWCDSTVNPVMGCKKGCELFQHPANILSDTDKAIRAQNSEWPENKSNEIFTDLIEKAYDQIEKPSEHHKREVTTTNLYHLRKGFEKVVEEKYGKKAALAARKTIERGTSCYAAKLHLNKGYSIVAPNRKNNAGYAPTFEEFTPFEKRVSKAADLPDLLGCANDKEPWMGTMARTIFVSDMGDAFGNEADFDFLEKDTMAAINSESGKKHLWLWLTKQPQSMAKFADRIGGFPENVCAMTTMTSTDSVNQKRLRDLKGLDAPIKGLSIEPLLEEIKPEDLDLQGIDWVIVGGESGSKEIARPFHLEWVRSLRDHCKAKGVAFFVKQMGSNPQLSKMPLSMNDNHGGDWNEWAEDLKIREFPQAFLDYRKSELDEAKSTEFPHRDKGRSIKAKVKEAVSEKLADNEKEDLERLEETITRGVTVFMQVGHALAEIKGRKLYREEYKSFQEYCEKKHGFTRQYGYLLADAAKIHDAINPLLVERGLQGIETERSLRILKSLKDEQQNEVIDIMVEEVEDKTQPIPFEVIKKAVDSVKQKTKAEKNEDKDEDEDGGGDGTAKPETKDPTPGGSALPPYPGDAESDETTPKETEGVVVEEERDTNPDKNGPSLFSSQLRKGFKEPSQSDREPSGNARNSRLIIQLEDALQLARDGKTVEVYAKLQSILLTEQEAA